MEENRLPKSIAIAIFLAALLLAHASIARSDEGREFALLVNGGSGKEKNSPEYDARLKDMYGALAKRGIPKDRIQALSGSGKTEDIRTNDFGGAAAAVAKAFDYDGKDGPEVTGPATEQSIETAFAELGKKMKAGDHLTLVVTGPSKKEMLSGRTRLRLWGQDIDSKELGRLLRKLPGGVQTTLVTDIAFGGDLVELSNDNLCVFAAHDGKSAGLKSDAYFSEFARKFSQAGTSVADAHRSAAKAGKNTVSDFVWEQIAKLDRDESKRAGGKVCVDCAVEKALNAQDPEISRQTAADALRLSKDSSLEELLAVIKQSRPQYLTEDLKQRVAFFEAKSFKDRVALLEAQKRSLTDRRSRGVRNLASARSISAENEATSLRADVETVKRDEKDLVEKHEALMDELRFVASANPSAIAEYQKRKECENHAY